MEHCVPLHQMVALHYLMLIAPSSLIPDLYGTVNNSKA
jgi:hypothetical protein